MDLHRIPRNSLSNGRLINAIESLSGARTAILAEAERGLVLMASDPTGASAAEYFGVSVEILTTVLLPRFAQIGQITLLPLYADLV